MGKLKRIFAAFTAMILLCLSSVTASAYEFSRIPQGEYQIKAALSCYVNAMGGVEFGAPLLTSARLAVAADGSKTMTLFFTKSSVTIYRVTCDTFVDVSPFYVTETNGIKNGTLGYYNADGALVTDDITYTLSQDTAENAQQEQVHYVDSVTFPIRYESDTYQLSLFVNSNVMGTQFTADGYAAALTVDWSSVASCSSSEPDSTPQEPDSAPSEPEHSPSQTEPSDKAAAETQPEPNGTNIAFFREPLLIAVGIAAGVMIIAGVILVAADRKEKK